jgi:hypothetical protein
MRMPLKRYRVLVEGANFLITFDNEATKHGFFTTRFVEADGPEAAETIAMDMIRLELADLVENDMADSPVMFLEEIEEIDSFIDSPSPGAGFAWFPDEKGH